ncbi:NAD(P)-dependent glycerol-3-phosphate dehydrogenase [Thalassococcus profundi]|uniref:Glycerol-3-phosphate dehydrogenase [NAD(P)+] n=1 Tax=Thalassococcus profundi TaxID=2282382 RepID=A0A369TH44_9RHOB|nr:NAD(P)H-dependent glycerol-3-phosphate dehydrogenase [Thalassococcus profundi]RDD64661.1 NAD(P)-dependent glycerol-3-phosphate dehydrogenase [Thalassococcus profundi]
MSIAVLGSGAFGTALAIALCSGGREVTLWARDPATVTAMRETRRAPRLPEAPLPDSLTLTDNLAEAARAPVLLLSVPMQSLSSLLGQIDDDLDGTALVACCKGIDLASMTGPSGVIATAKPQAVPAVLTGPSFAKDIAAGLPTALTLACAEADWAQDLQRQLSTRSLRLYRSDDMVGAELGGALKNVIAIACGAAIGAGLGDSARAALLTRGFAEMMRIAEHMGARAETLNGLCGLGDLTLTCTSDLSRNYRLGLALGRGTDFNPNLTVEGAATAQALAKIAETTALDLPICTTVAHLVTGALSVSQALDALISRPLKEE